jgi:small conductance mechanosensitive channel
MCKPCVPVRILNGQQPVQGDHTINATRRVDMAISISYEDDMKKAKKVIEGVSASDRRILPDPAPVVAVSAPAECRANLVARPWVTCADYWPAYFDLTANIKLALEKNALTIPFPQQDVHLKNGNLVAAAGGRT